MKYVGLTDDPDARKRAHGNPIDWNEHPFDSEEEARLWENIMMESGYQGNSSVDGWKYGYTYTITENTKE
jgi:hypothetical protein